MQISAASTASPYSVNQVPLVSQALTGEPTAQDINKTSTNDPVETGAAQQQGQPQELSEDEKRQVNKLQDRDREVRAHEAAHLAAAGGLARGGASFSYQTGPDGRAYAVGGEVSIDTSPVDGNPQATIQKAQTIRAAALAPAQPSGADQAAAAAASKLEASARIELAAQRAEEQQAVLEDDPTQDTKETTEELQQTDLRARNANSEANHYQDTVNPEAASDLVGQLLNTSA